MGAATVGDGAQGARPGAVRDARRGRTQSRPWRPRLAGSRGISENGCAGCRASPSSTADGLRRSLRMRSSRWDAQGNIYLVTEDAQTPDSVRANVGDTDGVARGVPPRRRLARDRDLEPRRLARRDVGQRHAHRGALARRADRRDGRRRPRRPARGRRRGCSTTCWSSRTSVRSSCPSRRRSTASASSPSTSATRTLSWTATRTTCCRIGPRLEVHPRFPRRTNVQVARVVGRRRDRGARLGAWRGRDGVVGLERRRGRGSVRDVSGRRPLPGRRARRALRGNAGVPDRAGRSGLVRSANRRSRTRAARRSATSSGRSPRCAGR